MPVVLALVLLFLAPIAASAQMAGSTSSAVASITADDIHHRIGVIADDSMRGRDTPSPELDEVAEYIAQQFASFGLAPGGDRGSYLQRYPIDVVQFNVAASSVAVAGGPTWAFGPDVVRRFGNLEGTVDGPVVVVDGTGDAAALADADLSNKVVLWVQGNAGQSRQLYRALSQTSPKAVVSIVQRGDAQWSGFAVAQGQHQSRVGGASGSGSAWIEVRDRTIASALSRYGYDLAAARGHQDHAVRLTPLDEMRITIHMESRVLEHETAPNVVGILEGSDPALRNQYVVFSGHMDHVGVGQPVNGDSIWNGADDDASGTIGVVELAQAFSMLDPAPKRSMIFLTVSGEEKGLWGSAYFASHPAAPIEEIVADLNMDMIGRNWRDTIVVIGKEHSDLGATLNRVNAEHPELEMTAIDDIWPEENFYSRSDHFNFARRGVPILFFFNGTHPDYHRPSDELDKIDAEKESRIVKLVFYLGLDVANAARRPQWNPESYREIVGG
jgi:Peptidase family M28